MVNPVVGSLLGVTLIVSVILILVAGRREDAGADRRTEARYLGALGYVVLFVGLLASYLLVRSLMDLVVDRARSNDVDYRRATQAGLVAVTAIAIFVFHYRRRNHLIAAGVYEAVAPTRVARAYFYGVCFTAMVLVLLSAPAAIYGIFRIIGPGVYGPGPHKIVRQMGIAELVSFAYLAVASLIIFRFALQRVERPGTPTTPVA
jgi:hypothetical protein